MSWDELVADIWAFKVESAGLPAVSADGRVVAYLDVDSQPSAQMPRFDIALVLVDTTPPGSERRFSLLGQEEWDELLPPSDGESPAVPGTSLAKAAEAYEQLRSVVAMRVEGANSAFAGPRWRHMPWCAAEPEGGEADSSSSNAAGLRVSLVPSAAGPPVVQVRDAAGNLLLDQPSAGLLAARPSVPGYDCGNAPLARAVAVDATLGVLLVEASQWPAADACPTSRLYAVYRFARRPENR